MRGWVYVLSNKGMIGIVKVGFSMKDPSIRASELSGTSTPHDFVVEYEVLTDNPRDIERVAHRTLTKSGLHEGREYFKCSIGIAVSHIRAATRNNLHLENAYNENALVEIERNRKKEQERTRRDQKRRQTVANEQALAAQRKREQEQKETEVRHEISALAHQAYELNTNWKNENKEHLLQIEELTKESLAKREELEELISNHNIKPKIYGITCYFLLYGSLALVELSMGGTLEKMVAPFLLITTVLTVYIFYRIIKKKEYIPKQRLQSRLESQKKALETKLKKIQLTQKPVEVHHIHHKMEQLRSKIIY